MQITKRTLVYGKHTIKVPDKMGEIVDLGGMDFKGFWLNPVILYGDRQTLVGHVKSMDNADDGLWVTDMSIIDDAVALAVERGDLVPVLTFRTKKYEHDLDVPVHSETELLGLFLVPKDKAVQ